MICISAWSVFGNPTVLYLITNQPVLFFQRIRVWIFSSAKKETNLSKMNYAVKFWLNSSIATISLPKWGNRLTHNILNLLYCGNLASAGGRDTKGSSKIILGSRHLVELLLQNKKVTMYLPFPEFFKYTERPMGFSGGDDITEPIGTGYYNVIIGGIWGDKYQVAWSVKYGWWYRELNNCMLPSEAPVSKESEKDTSLSWMLTILPSILQKLHKRVFIF